MTTTPRRFQEATIKAAVECLKGKGRRRFLVADEVGLGKTLVAREVLRKLSGGGEKPFTVYYVTSNTKVSDQNANRLVDFLGSAARDAVSRVDRLGLIPLEPPPKALRVYPLAPLTSFPPLAASPQTGKKGERAFIALLLERCYPGILLELPAGLLQQRVKTGWKTALDRAHPLAKKVPRKFVDSYRSALVLAFGHNARKRIVDASQHPKQWRKVIARQRRALAEACLLATPPDLLVFDEFQRYRELLFPAKEDRLVRALLEGKKGRGPAMMLLSATPYRLFSESWENMGGAQPHEELFGIIEFLGGPTTRNTAEQLFTRFGAILRSIGQTSDQPLEPGLIETAEAVRREIESLLRPLMARTERHEARDIEGPGTRRPDLSLQPIDLHLFRHFADAVPPKFRTAAVCYWLSVPLPAQALGARYKISGNVEFRPERALPTLTSARRTRGAKDGWGSAKLRALLEISPLDQLALPWVAPSLAWWPLGGAWRDAPSPKLLMFSRFRATPQSVAGLTSLEVERRYAETAGVSYNQAWARRKLQAKANQGATLALFHPSTLLIEATDPLKGKHATPAQARFTVKRQLATRLKRLGIGTKPRRKADANRHRPSWQVLAAIEKASDTFADNQTAWTRIADQDGVLANLLAQRAAAPTLDWISTRELDDLADMAFGGPAIVAGRAWLRHFDEALEPDGLYALTRFCWQRFRHYLDNPVFWGRFGGGKPTRILQAAVINGGLESLLDEHFWLARARVSPDALVDDLHDALGAASGWFTFRELPTGRGVIRVRCHAAVPFGGTDTSEDPLTSEDGTRPARSHELRRAFNAPFWPHVLATTSVGQEGLDFHSWCDQIAHWDLPSNPVDLEQREGRISRFGGLVVRRPLAQWVGADALADAARIGGSPWCHLEQHAQGRHSDAAGLSPWWLLKGATIERYVLSLPQSRDVERFQRLRRQRLLYRVALGQPNQEDLIDLLARADDERVAALAALTLDLSAFREEPSPEHTPPTDTDTN